MPARINGPVMRMATGPEPDTYEFVQQAQTAALTWLDPDPVKRASTVCDLLRAIPQRDREQDRVVIALVVKGIAAAYFKRVGNDDLSVATRRRRGRIADLHVVRALDYIMREFQDSSLRLPTVAKKCGVSAPYLSQLVKATTGYGCRTHLRLVRVLCACNLLTKTALSVKEVAARSGYRSTAELDHEFRRWLHLQPNEFRRWAT